MMGRLMLAVLVGWKGSMFRTYRIADTKLSGSVPPTKYLKTF
jgi:hypothetical protein